MSTKQHASLTKNPPGNLKEAIDWILSVHGLDGGKGGDGSQELRQEVVQLLGQIPNEYQDQNMLEKVEEELNKIAKADQLIFKMAKTLNKFIDGIAKQGSQGNFSSHKKDTYTSNAVKRDGELCACIFLGCIPLIFGGLSYLYWQCNDGKDNMWVSNPYWKAAQRNQTKGSNKNNPRWKGYYIWDSSRSNTQPAFTAYKINEEHKAVCLYFECSGYDHAKLNGKEAIDVPGLLNDLFPRDADVSNSNYSQYIKQVLDNTAQNVDYATTAKDNPFTFLYLASQYYFQYKQSQLTDCNREPKAIREMLYWLMALPYTKVFQQASEAIKQGITKHGSGGTPAKITFTNGVTLNSATSPFDCYLSTTCHYASCILMTLEGRLKGNTDNATKSKDNTLLHNIYSNLEFKFHYPDTIDS
ncbi:uncharacterized protein BXIN_1532 [Babesia sp. Xinjiang]|uniref:uncharacterized protein n=1 Tax=Babesia sp. Xinjiang TaxID=462227 RepID=UPI000A257AF9|nr:uncharacterized protein BXIN_1532 [Babesia sp. Xinjiang]ORM42292.1 hypothetical protein BXIN_1532 [Babesia sp. Xinjiang]